MATRPISLQEQTIYVVGGYSDAPGFKIVFDGNKITVVPIPGWDPEVALELAAALKVVAAGAQIKQPEAANAILTAATRLASAEIGRLTGGAGAGHTTVIVAGA